MTDQLVSVVVPTYNRAHCICRAIESIRNQTHPNWEVLLVDDGSTDNTAAVIAANYGADPRIRYIHQQNAGVSAARNTGIRAAQGDFVALLDSDDVWKPWKLETQLACFRAFPTVGMVWTNFEAVNRNGILVSPRHLTVMYDAYRFFESFEKLFGNSRRLADIPGVPIGLETDARAYYGNIYPQMLRGSLVHTSTVILSRERIAKVKGFDVALALSGEDYDFHFRTCQWGDVCLIDVSSTVYQLEFEDRLTRHMKAVALNFLKTIEGAIARESGTSVFPSSTIHEVQAEAHAWVAEEMLKDGDYARVRHHALLGLRHRAWQPRLFSLLAIALMPRAVSDPLLKSYRSRKFKSIEAKKN